MSGELKLLCKILLGIGLLRERPGAQGRWEDSGPLPPRPHRFSGFGKQMPESRMVFTFKSYFYSKEHYFLIYENDEIQISLSINKVFWSTALLVHLCPVCGYFRCFPDGSVVNSLPKPGSGGSPGEGNGNPPQYSCLENPMDRGVAKESDTT